MARKGRRDESVDELDDDSLWASLYGVPAADDAGLQEPAGEDDLLSDFAAESDPPAKAQPPSGLSLAPGDSFDYLDDTDEEAETGSLAGSGLDLSLGSEGDSDAPNFSLGQLTGDLSEGDASLGLFADDDEEEEEGDEFGHGLSLSASSADLSEPAAPAPPVDLPPAERGRNLMADGDLIGAYNAFLAARAQDPGDAIVGQYITYLEPQVLRQVCPHVRPSMVPMMGVSPGELMTLQIDPLMGYVLSLVDGFSSVEELEMVAGHMGKVQLYQLLGDAYEMGIIELERD